MVTGVRVGIGKHRSAHQDHLGQGGVPRHRHGAAAVAHLRRAVYWTSAVADSPDPDAAVHCAADHRAVGLDQRGPSADLPHHRPRGVWPALRVDCDLWTRVLDQCDVLLPCVARWYARAAASTATRAWPLSPPNAGVAPWCARAVGRQCALSVWPESMAEARSHAVRVYAHRPRV